MIKLSELNEKVGELLLMGAYICLEHLWLQDVSGILDTLQTFHKWSV